MYTGWQLQRWETTFSDATIVCMTSLWDSGRGHLEIQLEVKQAGEWFSYRVETFGCPAYRNINETYRLQLWEQRDKAWPGRDLGWTWKVGESPWLQEFSKEPLLMDLNPGLVHYVLCTEDDVIEFLTNKEPKVEFLGQIQPQSKLGMQAKSRLILLTFCSGERISLVQSGGCSKSSRTSPAVEKGIRCHRNMAISGTIERSRKLHLNPGKAQAILSVQSLD